MSLLVGTFEKCPFGKSYEHLADVNKWQAPGIMAEMVSKYLQRDSLILDMGSGTGLVGKELNDRGFRRICKYRIS